MAAVRVSSGCSRRRCRWARRAARRRRSRERGRRRERDTEQAFALHHLSVRRAAKLEFFGLADCPAGGSGKSGGDGAAPRGGVRSASGSAKLSTYSPGATATARLGGGGRGGRKRARRPRARSAAAAHASARWWRRTCCASPSIASSECAAPHCAREKASRPPAGRGGGRRRRRRRQRLHPARRRHDRHRAVGPVLAAALHDRPHARLLAERRELVGAQLVVVRRRVGKRRAQRLALGEQRAAPGAAAAAAQHVADTRLMTTKRHGRRSCQIA